MFVQEEWEINQTTELILQVQKDKHQGKATVL